MTDLIERKLHRLAGKLSGGLSRPGQQPYAAATAIWAKPVARMPRVVAHCQTTRRRAGSNFDRPRLRAPVINPRRRS